MKALSVRAPWWWFILYAGKDIENRDWPTRFRGRVWLHASSWWSLRAVIGDFDSGISCWDRGVKTLKVGSSLTWREMRDTGGAIVGSLEIVGCVRESDSPWFFGDYGFELRNVVAFSEPVKCKGALGFFDLPADVESRCREQEFLARSVPGGDAAVVAAGSAVIVGEGNGAVAAGAGPGRGGVGVALVEVGAADHVPVVGAVTATVRVEDGEQQQHVSKGHGDRVASAGEMGKRTLVTGDGFGSESGHTPGSARHGA